MHIGMTTILEILSKKEGDDVIYITGDIHADPRRFSVESFPEQREMSKDDFVIICGDFGLCWETVESDREKYWLDWLEKKPFTTVFIDGNHEAFDRLNAFPIEQWQGGRVHKLREHVIHLMRGEIFTLCNRKIFTFGGARSHDITGLATNEELKQDYTAGVLKQDDPQLQNKIKMLNKIGIFTRIEGKTWWRAEMPTEQEMQHGLDVLQLHNMNVDFIVSHDGPASDLALLGGGLLSIDPLNKYFEQIKQTVSYKWWFFGHHHEDRQITAHDAVLYHQILRIA